jgi:hypothetical protein
METRRLHAELLDRNVRVLVVGCGGTGSAIIGGLPYLHLSMRARVPYSLGVTVMDGDNISPPRTLSASLSAGRRLGQIKRSCWFRYGEIYSPGACVDVASSRAVPLAVDSWVWRRIRKGGGTARALAQRLNPGA